METDNKEVEDGIKLHPLAILDEHTYEQVSRQRKYQKRMADKGCCTKCGVFVEVEKVYHSERGFEEKIFRMCPKHRAQNRERQKRYRTYGGTA